MKQRVFLLSCLLTFAFTAMAQIDTGKWYRVKDVTTGLYFTALNHEAHYGAVGGVAVAEKDADNLEQVFRLEDAGDGFYKMQTLTGYNVCFSFWNVDALDQEASLIKMVEVETDVYQFKNGDKFFKVENVGGIYYPFNDGAEAVAAKFQLEDAGNDNFKVGNEAYYLDPVLDEAGFSYFVILLSAKS